MTEKLATISEILSSIQSHLKVPKDKDNAFGGFKYRNAEGILQAVKDELNKEIYPKNCIITVNCAPKAVGNKIFIKATAILAGFGDSIKAVACAGLDESKKGMDQAQLTGSATSYAKKYALCNLFAIDDSKDDPDADENTKEELTKKKNAFGLSKEGELANGEDMKETLKKQNQEDFAGLKAIIENCGGIEELNEIWKDKKNQAIIAKLKKWETKLYDMLIEAKDVIKAQHIGEEVNA